MGPRFDDALEFEAGDKLEVCGPTGFDKNDVGTTLTLRQVVIVDRKGTTVTADVDQSFPYGQDEWMVTVDRRALIPGAATGTAHAIVRRPGKPDKRIDWSDHDLELVGPK